MNVSSFAFWLNIHPESFLTLLIIKMVKVSLFLGYPAQSSLIHYKGLAEQLSADTPFLFVFSLFIIIFTLVWDVSELQPLGRKSVDTIP